MQKAYICDISCHLSTQLFSTTRLGLFVTIKTYRVFTPKDIVILAF